MNSAKPRWDVKPMKQEVLTFFGDPNVPALLENLIADGYVIVSFAVVPYEDSLRLRTLIVVVDPSNCN